jgi:hypothetical protein
MAREMPARLQWALRSHPWVVDVQTVIMILPETDQIIRIEVEERFAGLLRGDMDVSITSQAGDNRERHGTIKRVSRIMGAGKNKELDPTDKVGVRVVEVVVTL